AVLPDAVLIPPLRARWIALVLMDVVHAVAGRERLAPDERSLTRGQDPLEGGACLDMIATLPHVEKGFEDLHEQTRHGVGHHDEETAQAHAKERRKDIVPRT